jgi:hypothetical protein
MKTQTLKTSTIFVSTGRRTRVFRSITEIPDPLRKRVSENLSGPNTRTLIVADRGGREYLIQALRGVAASQASSRRTSRKSGIPAFASRAKAYWLEITLIGFLGLSGWSLFLWN